MEQRYAKILATGMYLPEKVISNEELSERYGFDVTSSHPFKGWASSFTEESLRGCRGCSPVSAQRPPSPEA